MNRKFYPSALLILFTFTACGTGKWKQVDPNMPEELVEYHQDILEQELEILKTDPENMDALFEVAFRYQQLGEWSEAIKYYERVLEISENDWATLNNLAYMYETLEDYEMASDYIRRLYVADPSNIEVVKDTVRILLKAGNTLNAREAVDNFSSLTISTDQPSQDMVDLLDSLYADIEEVEGRK